MCFSCRSGNGKCSSAHTFSLATGSVWTTRTNCPEDTFDVYPFLVTRAEWASIKCQHQLRTLAINRWRIDKKSRGGYGNGVSEADAWVTGSSIFFELIDCLLNRVWIIFANIAKSKIEFEKCISVTIKSMRLKFYQATTILGSEFYIRLQHINFFFICF